MNLVSVASQFYHQRLNTRSWRKHCHMPTFLLPFTTVYGKQAVYVCARGDAGERRGKTVGAAMRGINVSSPEFARLHTYMLLVCSAAVQ